MKLRPCGRNSVRIEDGIAYVDVSTKSFPGCIAKIDAEDLPLVLDGNGRWHATKTERSPVIYVERNGCGVQPKQKMHRTILDAPHGIDIDHVNRDGLDNRRGNLRLASRSENMRNSVSYSGSSSRYKGVAFHGETGKWRAQITNARYARHLGVFEVEADAARAYDAAARQLFGEFARTNFGEPA